MSVTGNRNSQRQARLAGELAAAFAHHQAGRLDRAAAAYRKILARQPGNADALHLLGVIVLGEGRAERAMQLIGRAVAAAPDFALAHCNLGNAQLETGRAAEAKKSYLRALALDPDLPVAHNNLGRLLSAEGDFAGGAESCARAVALAPDLAEAHNNLATAYRGLGRLDEAETALRRALELEPGNPSRHVSLGNLLMDRKRFEEAEACYRRAIAVNPAFAAGHYGLATRLRVAGEMKAAIASYRAALMSNPSDQRVWNDLGRALRALGRFEEAGEAFRRAIDIDPDFADAYRNLATCRQLTAEDAAIARLAALAAQTDLAIEDRAAAGFAVGKAFDDAERFDDAFAAYDEANRLYREARAAGGERFDATALRDQIDTTIDRFTRDYFAAVADWGNRSELPVFIVGMPRSGTSLVEQIAASHSRVFGAGELRDIGELAAAALDQEAVPALAEAYLARLRALGGDADRVIDKMPDNIFMLGAIATLFPGARVIFCRRDPRDICLSCYFQKFNAGQLMFSYDLGDCGRRYRETERLAAHWRRTLPLRMIDVRYETLVANLEAESRRLIGFLGLDWEPSCLEFHRTERTVTTASGWQVRQPVYDSSIGRWRKYERHLGPLFAALGDVAADQQ